MAGGGSLTAGSGIVSEDVSSGFNQANAASKILESSIKKMPAPVVSVKEFNKVDNKVKAKEKASL